MIELNNLCVSYHDQQVLSNISAVFPNGKITAILGPNGSGKSTLMKSILGLQPVDSGTILINGVDSRKLSRREQAQTVAYMAQDRNIPSIISSRMVLHGRFPYMRFPRKYSPEDVQIARQSMGRVDALELANRLVNELSGGQRQKVFLAMMLAQSTQYILMDEPTTFLDIKHQLELMNLSRSLADEGKTVIMVLHDIILAMKYADRFLILDNGQVCSNDTPEQIVSSGICQEVFGLDICYADTPDGRQYYYS